MTKADVENMSGEGVLPTLSSLQKVVALFVAIAGGALSITQSPNLSTTIMLVGIIVLSLILVLWVNNRMRELSVIAADSVRSERKCVENLHQRDKLLGILYYDLKRRSGRSREQVPDLDKIVGPEVARVVRDAAAMMDFDVTQDIKVK